MFTFLLQILSTCFPLMGYLKSQAFPQPLDHETEQELLQRWKKKDIEARNLLIEHNLRLVAHIAKKYESKKSCTEDLISIGTLGLIKAVDTYKFDIDTKLTTYAARCIENEILMHFRKIKRTYQDISLNDPIGYDKDGNEIALIDVIDADTTVDIPEQLYHKEQLTKLRNYLHDLDSEEYEILKLRFGLNNEKPKTQRQIAKEQNLSRSYVSRIEKRAFIKLLKKFNEDDVH